MSTKPKAYLCYAADDKVKANLFRERLKSVGFNVWDSQISNLGGEDQDLNIAKAISDCVVFIYFVSKDSISKPGIHHKELSLALERQKRFPRGHIFVIPLVLDQTEVPFDLKRYYQLNYEDDNIVENIVEAIKKTNSMPIRKQPDKMKSEKAIESVEDKISVFFVGRANALKEFYNLFSYRRQKNILYIQADGGLGKSWLLHKFSQDNKNYEGARLVFGPFNFAELRLRSVQELRHELINNLGKKSFRSFLKAEAAQARAESQDKSSSILAAKKEKADFEFFENLNDCSTNREVVLLFDTFEAVHNTEVGRWFLDEFLIKADNLIVAFAGRPTVPALKIPFRAQMVQLSPFNHDEAEEFFIRNAGRFHFPPDLLSRKQIEKLCDKPGIDGQPLRLELALHFSGGRIESLQKIISSKLGRKGMEKKLIDIVGSHDEPIYLVFRDMAILKRRYDQDIIKHLMTEENMYKDFRTPKEITTILDQHNIVKPNPNGSYTLHDRIQDLVDEHILPFGEADSLRDQLYDSVVDGWYVDQIERAKQPIRRDLLVAEQLGYELEQANNENGLRSYEKYFRQVMAKNLFSFDELIMNELSSHKAHLPNRGYDYFVEQAKWLYTKNRFAQAAGIFGILSEENAKSKDHSFYNNFSYLIACMLVQGQYSRVIDEIGLGYEMARSQGNNFWLSLFEDNLAFAYEELGNWTEAEKYYASSLQHAIASDDDQQKCRGYIRYAEFIALLGNYKLATRHCENALNLIRSKRLDDQWKGQAYLAIGKIKRYDRNYSDADYFFREAYNLFQKAGGQEWIGVTLQHLGANQQLIGYNLRKLSDEKLLEAIDCQSEAFKYLADSLRICRLFNLSSYLPESLYRLGRLFAEVAEIQEQVEGSKLAHNSETRKIKVSLDQLTKKILSQMELPEEDFWRKQAKLVYVASLKSIKLKKSLYGLAQRFCEVSYLEADRRDRVHASFEGLVDTARIALRRSEYHDVMQYAEKIEFLKGVVTQEELFVALMKITIGDLHFKLKQYSQAAAVYRDYLPILSNHKGYGLYRFERYFAELENRIKEMPGSADRRKLCKELLVAWGKTDFGKQHDEVIAALQGLIDTSE